MTEDVVIRILLFTCNFVYAIALYVAFPSRFNIQAHLATALCFPYFFFPILWPGLTGEFSREYSIQYLGILSAGMTPYLLGLYVGFRFSSNSYPSFLRWHSRNITETDIVRRATLLVFIGASLVVFSFMVMGFIPMTAEDTYQAKFFRGIYQDSYRKVALFYRAGFYIMGSLSPLVAVYAIAKGRLFHLVLFVFCLGLYVVSLNRGPAGVMILLAAAPFAMDFNRGGHLFVFIAICAASLGALLYVPLEISKGEKSLSEIVEYENITREMASGAPDYKDSVKFLEYFDGRKPFAYGRTILGGMVPYQYEWNPANYALSVRISGQSGHDVSKIASGGLRLPMPIWGYANFGWVGVCVFAIITGFIRSYLIRGWSNTAVFRDHVSISISFLLLIGITLPLWEPYKVSMYDFVPVVLWAIILHFPRLNVGRVAIF